MHIKKRPTRQRLLQIIVSLQGAIGRAHGLHANDRDPVGFSRAQDELYAAHELCIEATSFDNPCDGLKSFEEQSK